MDRRHPNGVTAMLSQALDVKKGDMAVFVGGGGKTSAMNRLAREQVSCGTSVFLTTTTKIFPPQGGGYALYLVGDREIEGFMPSLPHKELKLIVLGKEINEAHKIVGLNIHQINELKRKGMDQVILVEGDGAKGKPFKAPRAFEPVIPEKADVVVPVVGIDAIGRQLNGTHFHAEEQICLLTGLKIGDCLQAKDVAAVLLDDRGYQKGVPSSARWVPLINKVETPQDREKALELVTILKEAGVPKVLIGALGVADSPVEIF